MAAPSPDPRDPGSISNVSTGQWTFLFTDIQGSTHLWEKHPEAMRAALTGHDDLFREAARRWNGHVFKTIGDAFCIAFLLPTDALLASVEIQQRLRATKWPEVGVLRVRMALYHGEAELRDNDYFGTALNRVARLRDTAHGNQIVLPKELLHLLPTGVMTGPGIAFLDKGNHRLKDIPDDIHIFQVAAPGLEREFPPLRTLSTHPHNLPPSLGPLIGRVDALREIGTYLNDPHCRLLTMTGIGGVGKTRLAIETARSLLERYPDGVWFTDLSTITDSTAVLPAILRVCGLTENPALTPQEQLQEHFAVARALLLLDNFEQVEEAAAEVASLIRRCEHLQVLVTSRVLLALSMEYEYDVPPLAENDAVDLFAVRARQVRAAFVLDGTTRPDVGRICHRLEGVPLAVELAAAQTRTLPLPELCDSLLRQLDVLTTRMRDLSPRQRSLRGAIDWSYSLLTPTETQLFRRLSAFAGTFTPEAVSTVCHPDAPTRELLDSLRSSSLIRYEPREMKEEDEATGDESGADSAIVQVPVDGCLRFRMLESLRQFGEERTAEAGETDALHAAHQDWFLGLARQVATWFHGPREAEGLRTLDPDYDNLRLALTRATHHHGAPAGLRLANALRHYWEVRGYFREGREHLEALLAASGGGAPSGAETGENERAEALHHAGALAWFQGDYAACIKYQERSAELFERCGNQVGAGRARGSLADAAYARGDIDGAYALHSRNLATYESLMDTGALADTRTSLGNVEFARHNLAAAADQYGDALVAARTLQDLRREAICLNNLGNIASLRKEFERASTYFRENLAARRLLGDRRGAALALTNLAALAADRNTLEEAHTLYRDAVRELGELDDSRALSFALTGWAQCFAKEGRYDEAVILFSAAACLRQESAATLHPRDEENMQTTLGIARSHLGENAFQVAWTSGQRLSLADFQL